MSLPPELPQKPGLLGTVRRSAGWLARLTLRVVDRREAPDRSRFLLISPPGRRRQMVLDRVTGERFAIRVRDQVDFGIVGQIFEREDYRLERLARFAELQARYDELVENGRTPLIVDCGANIGCASLYFSRRFPAARVMAIEPDGANLALARENCAGRSGVAFVEAGVASRSGRGDLVDPGIGACALRTRWSDTGAIRFVGLRDVLREEMEAGRVPFIVKIDIEGFEQELFSANLDWIPAVPLIVIELHDWLFPSGGTSGPFLRAIAREDRDFVHIGENVFSIANGH